MPDSPPGKLAPHPVRAPAPRAARLAASEAYAELAVTSNFSFLRGASHPEESVRRAAELGHAAAAIADRNSLAGVVRAHLAARETGLPLAVGARLAFTPFDAEATPPPELLVFATDRAGYGRLCRLLTDGKRRAEKGDCILHAGDLADRTAGLLAVVLPPGLADPGGAATRPTAGFVERARDVAQLFEPGAVSLGAALLAGADDERLLRELRQVGEDLALPLCALNDVHYHVAERRPLQDVLTCVRAGRAIDEAGLELFPNAERHLRSPAEMARLFRGVPDAVRRAVEVAERASAFSLDDLVYRYPAEVGDELASAIATLRELTWRGADERYPRGLSPKVRSLVERELALVDELGYAPFFLTVYDIVRFSRERRILCQGRGAAANSAICYCLGVTSVDPDRSNLLFERFVSKERDEPPDIDIDFEHERREEVIQFLYEKYGRDRAALTATVISYRGRSAVRDVGKALGFSPELCDRLAKEVDWWSDDVGDLDRVRALGLDPEATATRLWMRLTREALGFPRHLSQHVGGFVITEDPLCELVPIENAAMEDRTVIEWDKDDLDALDILKVDVLGLGMLSAIRKCGELVHRSGAEPRIELHPGGGLTLDTIPPEDPAVYDMICAADTVGVFQIESRAQMSMLPRLRPRNFYDLVIEVAIVRPGPIHGDMVHPYLRRRRGEEPVDYPSPAVKEVLERTLGVPLFQEQAMKLAVVAGGFTPGEADRLRRAMAAWKRKTSPVQALGDKLIAGMLERGYEREFAERIWRQLQGFSEYGFPESHAASFALLVYVSCWMKLYHPAAFTAALLNSQPMGFYAPAQLVRDAREHGVEVREVDVNHSAWDCTLELDEAGGPPAIRLGLRLVKGLREDVAEAIVAAVRARGSLATPRDLHAASGVAAKRLVPLARADAFGSMGVSRRAALWSVRSLRDEDLSLFEPTTADGDEIAGAELLPPAAPYEEVASDYASHGLSLRAHPVAFLREELTARDVTPAGELADERRHPRNTRVRVAGVVLVRQRPHTAHGILFLTLEDETGTANLVVHPRTFTRHRREARQALLLLVDGHVDREGPVVHVIAHRLEELALPEWTAGRTSRDFH